MTLITLIFSRMEFGRMTIGIAQIDIPSNNIQPNTFLAKQHSRMHLNIMTFSRMAGRKATFS